jgi:hypothetical protein
MTYTRQYAFSTTVSGVQLDRELDGVSQEFGRVNQKLGAVVRDDGQLQDGIVKRHALHAETIAHLAVEVRNELEPLYKEIQSYAQRSADDLQRVLNNENELQRWYELMKQLAQDTGVLNQSAQAALTKTLRAQQNTESLERSSATHAQQVATTEKGVQVQVERAKQVQEQVRALVGVAETASLEATERARSACECRRKAEEAANKVLQSNYAVELQRNEVRGLLAQVRQLTDQVVAAEKGIKQSYQTLITKISEIERLGRELMTARDQAVVSAFAAKNSELQADLAACETRNAANAATSAATKAVNNAGDACLSARAAEYHHIKAAGFANEASVSLSQVQVLAAQTQEAQKSAQQASDIAFTASTDARYSANRAEQSAQVAQQAAASAGQSAQQSSAAQAQSIAAKNDSARYAINAEASAQRVETQYESMIWVAFSGVLSNAASLIKTQRLIMMEHVLA